MSEPTPERPVLAPLLAPLAAALVPQLRAWMRRPGSVGLKRLLYRCITDPYTNLNASTSIETSAAGVRFEGTLAGVVQRALFHFGVFEPQLSAWLATTLRPGDGFIDVGANVGYFALHAARFVGPGGCVVALEPAPSTFVALERNRRLNAAENVRTVQAAAYDREATLPIYAIPAEEYTSGASLVRHVGPVEAEVRAAPLASLLAPDELRRARVVKIDVEGAEREVVRGLLPALAGCAPELEIVVEVFPDTAAEVQAMLGGAGFHAYLLDNPLTPLEATAETNARPVRLAPGVPVVRSGSAVGYLVFSRRDTAQL